MEFFVATTPTFNLFCSCAVHRI